MVQTAHSAHSLAIGSLPCRSVNSRNGPVFPSTPSATTKTTTSSLPPARHASGYRSYDDGDVARLTFVRRAKALGFTLREIRELLALSGRQGEDMSGVRDAASARLADVEHKIAELTRVREGLRQLVAACPGHGNLCACPILAALSTEDA